MVYSESINEHKEEMLTYFSKHGSHTILKLYISTASQARYSDNVFRHNVITCSHNEAPTWRHP